MAQMMGAHFDRQHVLEYVGVSGHVPRKVLPTHVPSVHDDNQPRPPSFGILNDCFADVEEGLHLLRHGIFGKVTSAGHTMDDGSAGLVGHASGQGFEYPSDRQILHLLRHGPAGQQRHGTVAPGLPEQVQSIIPVPGQSPRGSGCVALLGVQKCQEPIVGELVGTKRLSPPICHGGWRVVVVYMYRRRLAGGVIVELPLQLVHLLAEPGKQGTSIAAGTCGARSTAGAGFGARRRSDTIMNACAMDIVMSIIFVVQHQPAQVGLDLAHVPGGKARPLPPLVLGRKGRSVVDAVTVLAPLVVAVRIAPVGRAFWGWCWYSLMRMMCHCGVRVGVGVGVRVGGGCGFRSEGMNANVHHRSDGIARQAAHPKQPCSVDIVLPVCLVPCFFLGSLHAHTYMHALGLLPDCSRRRRASRGPGCLAFHSKYP